MSLLQQVDRILRVAGYRIQVSADRSSTIYFEDYSLFGFCTVYDSVGSLLQSWNNDQNEFLQKHAPFLRQAQRKAWNCYAVHLTAASAGDAETQALFDIEENFTSTRKIARANLVTESDVQRTLYPLIPIQNLLKMQASQSGSDISQRFHDWPPSVLKALLGTGSAEDIVDLLLEAE